MDNEITTRNKESIALVFEKLAERIRQTKLGDDLSLSKNERHMISLVELAELCQYVLTDTDVSIAFVGAAKGLSRRGYMFPEGDFSNHIHAVINRLRTCSEYLSSIIDNYDDTIFNARAQLSRLPNHEIHEEVPEKERLN